MEFGDVSVNRLCNWYDRYLMKQVNEELKRREIRAKYDKYIPVNLEDFLDKENDMNAIGQMREIAWDMFKTSGTKDAEWLKIINGLNEIEYNYMELPKIDGRAVKVGDKLCLRTNSIFYDYKKDSVYEVVGIKSKEYIWIKEISSVHITNSVLRSVLAYEFYDPDSEEKLKADIEKFKSGEYLQSDYLKDHSVSAPDGICAKVGVVMEHLVERAKDIYSDSGKR